MYDTLRYREALEPLVRGGGARAARAARGEVEVERAMEIVAAGVEPLRELIGAMHSKLLLAELRRAAARAAERGGAVDAHGYQRARWCSITPSPCASATPPGSVAGERAEGRA